MLLNRDVPRSFGASQVRAVIFDWAGTTVDHGSLAPVRTLERVFAEAGVPVTEAEARRDMGIAKRDHIAALLRMPRVANSWRQKYGAPPAEPEVDSLYEHFLPLQFACLKEYSKVIRGVPAVVACLRSGNIKIGSTTGYTSAMLDVLVAAAADEGYQPDCSFSPEDVGAGRPSPFMIFAAAIRMKVYPMAAIVKVGDTESDIAEALNAGAWAIGITSTGNGVGLAEEQFLSLAPNERNARIAEAHQQLKNAGAHYVINDLSELPSTIAEINRQLSRTASA